MNPITIELPAAELKTALTGLGKVINRHSTLPILSHVRFTRTGNGVVLLQATDLDSFVRYEAEQLGGSEPCEFLVPFEPLNKLVKGGKEPVQFIMEGTDKVRLKTFIGTSPMEQTFDTLPVDEFPPMPLTSGRVMPLDPTFRDRFRQALDCCSTDGSRHVIRHVCLDTRYAEGHYLAATDGRHLYCANSFQFDLKEPVLVPDLAFLRWNKFMEDGAGELSLKPKTKTDGSWLQLKSGRWTLTTKSCDVEFPMWKNAIPAPNSGRTRIQLDSSAVATLLAGVPKLPAGDDINRPVTLEVAGTTLTVKARAKDAKDWTQLSVDGVRVTGKSVSIRVNRDYLFKAMKFGLTTIEIEDDLIPLECSDGGRRMVISPLRPIEATVVTPAATTSTPSAATPAEAVPPVSAPNPQPINNSNPPVAEPPQAQPQQTSTMPKETQTTPTEAPTETSPVKAVIQHIENIKDTLKGVLREFAEVLDGLKQLEKEKKATDREMESVREKLREIQSVRI